MKVLDGSVLPSKRTNWVYVSSAQMTSTHLRDKLPDYIRLVKKEPKARKAKKETA
jgi:hypothetical protein